MSDKGGIRGTGQDYATLPYREKTIVDEICDDYEASFLSGEKPDTPDYLQNADRAIWPVLIHELFALDVAHRSDPINIIRQEYRQQFPTLSYAIESTVVANVALATGDTVGDYRIVRQIGRGGMGIVYEAEDMKLERRVALKFMTTEFSLNCARLERFQCEAKILAGLNHPNIATLYGFEEHERQHFCVLEFVPGRTLAEILRCKRLPAREALSIFTQIAEAVESAHESGVIHRDLKPANVKVTDNGQVKVLDFGLATSASLHAVAQSQEPAVIANGGHPRETGVAGTLPYMSPEQAAGKNVDKRSDIWAFGCCLYEALVGRRAFPSLDADELLKAIVQEEPDWNALPSETPPQMTRLVQRCLTKDARRRLRDIGDARIELQDCQLNPSVESETPPNQPFRHSAILASAAMALLAVIAAVSLWPANKRTDKIESRSSVNLPAELELNARRDDHAIALSPDGSLLAFSAAEENGKSYLYVRERASFDARKLADTRGACYPFFSPDGKRIGFFANDRGGLPNNVKTIAVSGGDALTVCHSTGPLKGGCWTSDDEILFASCWGSAIEAVGADGSGHRTIRRCPGRFPQMLPDGRTLLFGNGAMIDTASETSGSFKLKMAPNADFVRYLPSGHVVFSRGGSLYEAAAQLKPLRVVGEPRLLVDTEFEKVDFAVSTSGDIAFFRGVIRKGRLAWKHRDSEVETPIWPGARRYGSMRLSPDAKRLAVSIEEDDGCRLWIYDLSTKTAALLTTQGKSQRPVWMPDGERVIFRWTHEGRLGLAWKEVGVLNSAEWMPLKRSNRARWDRGSAASVFALEGVSKLISYSNSADGEAFSDIHELNLQDHSERPLLNSPYDEVFGELSPDGRWLLYLSTKDTGNYEAFVSDYPNISQTHRISKTGALDPMWSPSGDAIYFRAGGRHDEIIAATVAFDPFRVVKTETIISGTNDCPGYSFDYDANNDRFVIIRPVAESSQHNEIRWLQNSVR
jgi:serine/threonine protein kinase